MWSDSKIYRTYRFSIVVSCILFAASAQDKQQQFEKDRPKTNVLSNDSVIEFVKAGFGEPIILAKLKQSKCKFDLSQNEMVRLKSAGVSDAIVAEMMQIRPFEPHWPPKMFVAEDTGGGGRGIKGSDPTDIRLETIKTFKQHEWPVTMDAKEADLFVNVTRQMGKKSWSKDTKFTVSNHKGDVLHSQSTRSVGGAVANIIKYINKNREDPIFFE